MNILTVDSVSVQLQLSEAELALITNALNEVCNGIDLFEFEARMGGDRAQVTELMKTLVGTLEQLRQLKA
jgi:hypothetical protein